MKNLKDVNLVIISGSEKVQNSLRETFIKYGANIVLCGFMNMELVSRLEQNVIADIILVDMDDAYEEDQAAFDYLLDKIELPILFHENTFNNINDANFEHDVLLQEIKKVAIKLADLVNSNKNVNNIEVKPDIGGASVQSSSNGTLEHDENKCVSENTSLGSAVPVITSLASDLNLYKNNIPEQSTNVWVLGASIGGPEAVKIFLSKIPEELPVAFVLAQHLGDGFIPLLAAQLDNLSCFTVKEGIDGDILKHGEVVIVSVEQRMALDSKGKIKFLKENWAGHYKPSIDSVIEDVTNYYQKQSGVIIFSGMGNDGALACQKFSQQYEGKVWAQSSDTCVVSSMPDSVRQANLVSFSGSPEALALEISLQYMTESS